MYRTVIVEDDPLIAAINQTFLARDPRFVLAAAFHSGRDALPWLRSNPAELLILDVYMPRMSGLELLRELRAEEITLDVVMVTAANDSRTVDALLKLGVTDYLVKPFTAQRCQQALDTFARHPPPTRASVRRSWTPCCPAAGAGSPSPRGSRRAPWSGSEAAWPGPPGRGAPARPCPRRWACPRSPSAGISPIWWGGGRR